MTTSSLAPADRAARIIVAGPSSTLTLPGNIVSQIVAALTRQHLVTRIEVNAGNGFDAGLHRVPPLSAAHDWINVLDVESHSAPENARLRARAFREWVSDDCSLAVAYLWPGLDASWTRSFFSAAERVGALTVALCATVPQSRSSMTSSFVGTLASADLVVVGSEDDREALEAAYGTAGPRIIVHRALRLTGRAQRSDRRRVTAFIPRDDERSLNALLMAFDAIPDAWIREYRLNVVMRHSSVPTRLLAAASYHSENVDVIDTPLSDDDVADLVASSSALLVADPTLDSRAFSQAVKSGIATVVLTSAPLPSVGSGYVGGFLADPNLPVSVLVGMNHALRLADLQFPTPEAWDELASLLLPAARDPRRRGLQPTHDRVP